MAWFRAWLARFVALGGELAGALVTGILRALKGAYAPEPKKDEP